LAKQLAIMKDVGYGLRDTGRPCLFFTTYTGECSCALQVLFGKDADRVIKDARVYDIRDLEGNPCWVEKEGNLMRFLKVAHI